ncbi:MAG: filamentous hemagglutinin N-terminal domain-containing protein, partial [Deltaproteobacteria bacterium]
MNGKKIFKAIRILIFSLSLLNPSFVLALPQGESVVSGSATFEQATPGTLTITTPSDKLIVNYDSFNIGADETVRFVQPSAASVALNRVVGANPTSVLGSLIANGKIFLINPNGVLFGAGSRVDAAGLLASTLDISDRDFLNGNYVFSKNGASASLTNQGALTVRNGGYVCLLGQTVANAGEIGVEAGVGSIALAAGEKMTLNLDDAGDISVVIDAAVRDEVFAEGKDAVANSGTLRVEGGKVLLTAKVLGDVFDHAVNNAGVIEAGNLIDHDGIIELTAEGAPVVNSGAIGAGAVTVEAPGTSVTNTGKISADGTAERPDGGSVGVLAGTILQKGVITADSLEGGDGGTVSLVSEKATVLEGGSVTEAKAQGIVGNGGRITLDSKDGRTQVDTAAVIDISSAALLGDAGTLELGAFDTIGLYGTVSGYAPPWGGAATVAVAYHSPDIPPVMLVSDQADYPPAGTPVITGSGFTPNAQVTVNISSPDGTHASLTAVTDERGCFAVTYAPDTLLWGGYIATGTDGVRSAATTFTDAPKITMYAPTLVGTDLTLSWSYEASSAGYWLQTAHDDTFAIADTIDNIGRDDTSETVGLTPGIPYYFRVQAYKDNGYQKTAYSAWSDLIYIKPLLLITADNFAKTYGDTLTFAGTEFTYSGLASGDTLTGVPSPPSSSRVTVRHASV